MLVWHHPSPERWGAFAGGFEEVDENVVYEEREDEFDIVSHRRNLRAPRTNCSLQEDESELERRKKIEEEQLIDIDTSDDLPNQMPTGGTAPAPPHQLHARLQALSGSRSSSRLGTPAPTPGTPNGQVLGGVGAVVGTPAVNGEVDDDTAWALDEPDDDMPGWTLKVVIEATPEY